MKRKTVFKKILIVLLITTFFIQNLISTYIAYCASNNSSDSSNQSFVDSYKKYTYYDYLNNFEKQLKQSLSNRELENISIKISPKDIINSAQIKIVDSFEGKNEPIIIWEKDGFCEFKSQIPISGFYKIKVEYYSLKGTNDTIQRRFYIDDKIPFYEATSIPFFRYFKNKTNERIFNSVGDEINSSQEEIKAWRTQYLMDINGGESDGFVFYLEKGEHTFKFEYVSQGMAISNIIIEGIKNLNNYNSYIKRFNIKEQKNVFIKKIQAEEVFEKNDTTIKKEYSGDPVSEPFAKSNILLNYFGGWRWRKANQEATWRIDVPQDGLYKIGLRYIQNFRDGLISFRQILIDGQTPFSELKGYPFKYSREWQFEWLGNDKPFYIYLTKGTHLISFRNTSGLYDTLIYRLDKISYDLSELVNKIIMITSSSPDLNFDYELDKKIPNLIKDFNSMISSLEYVSKTLSEINKIRPSIVNQIMAFKDQLNRMVNDPYIIPRQLNDLMNAQTTITDWMEELKNQPLGIDYFIISDKESQYRARKSNIFERIYVSCLNFINSFKKDYDKVAGTKDYKGEKYKNINVWVARGKEWAEAMKRLADEEFTPKTNINVTINVLPAGQLSTGGASALLLSLVSKSYPDVACGVDRTTPVELAIRDATVDLSKMKDFNNVINRFHEGIIESFKYNNGIYALPETMDFTVMFYRKDILDKLKLSLPETWDDLYRKVIPVLSQNGMQFYYYPPNINNSGDAFIPFLYQRNGSFYTENNLKSALDSEKAYMAFKEWTELYSIYKVPVSANFFNRFRTGEMPIGVAGYDMYIALMVAAPELFGRWGIAPIPGHANNGKIDRSAPAITTSDVILNGSNKKDEAWEFLKWWTSEETQVKFGQEIESIIGPEARWNTANLNAFLRLPWKSEDISVIKGQWQWYKTQPIVLGGYFTNRHLLNAWTKVVVDNKDMRDSLEKAYKDINKEMHVKQKEYGLAK